MTISGKASLIILTYNNLDYTQKCLQSIFEKTEYPNYEVIVVDNASQDETPRYLNELASQHTSIHAILNQANEGFARGNNMGASAATGDYLVFLNNDVVVTPGWLTRLLKHLQDTTVGMVGPVTNASGNETRIAVDYQSLEELDDFALRYTSAHAGEAFEIRMLPFQCVALRRQVFDEIGLLDERFETGMFEDDDYALRIKEKDYRILCAEDVYIHHFGSASFGRLDWEAYWRLFATNLRKYEEKWGIKWLPTMVRPEFLPERFRQILDGTVWFTHLLEENKTFHAAEIASLKQSHDADIAAYTAKVEADTKEIYRLSNSINDIYQSNGWAFLQYLLRVRRWFIPERSKREQFLRLFLGMVRGFTRNRLVASLREAGDLLKKRKKVAQPSAGMQAEAVVSPETIRWESMNSPMPLVSVILPVYNHADMLEQAAEGVLRGTYPHFELIILDDGSTDEIDLVLKRLFANPRVSIYRQPNQKLPRALTHAHRFCKGQLITWTSSDNLMAPNALEVLVNGLLAHPEAALVYADVSLIDDQGNTVEDESYRPQNLDPERKGVMRLYRDARPLGYEADNYINACFMYRREAAMALEGYYADDLRGLEDYDFWLRMQKIAPLVHLRNREPLYYYRVHSRTMSHEILSQSAERQAHIKRLERFIKYEESRRNYARARWEIVLDESLPSQTIHDLSQLAAQLPLDARLGGSGWEMGKKRLRFTSPEAEASDPISVKVYPDRWQLTWRSWRFSEVKELELYRGVDISPLALKARQFRKNKSTFARAGERPVLLCHAGLANLPVDLEATRQFILRNPKNYFVFLDCPEQANQSLGEKLVDGLENGLYMGSRPVGEPYSLYACSQAIWLPLLAGELSEFQLRPYLSLAYAVGRPLVEPTGLKYPVAPYQIRYSPQDSVLELLRDGPSALDVDVADRYLAAWSSAASLVSVLRYADGILQDVVAPRPDFGIQPPPEASPTYWFPPAVADDKPVKCVLLVNNLDKGGMEEVVAQLARRLPEQGIEAVVVCVDKGGMIAQRLKEDDVKVWLADGKLAMLRDVLQKEQPDVVNSHLARLEALQVVCDLGLPVVETIHNTYVWFSRSEWKHEQRRSSYFSRAVAVSELVRKYYLKWNPAFPEERVIVVPNGIDVDRLTFTDRLEARQKLEFADDEFWFLSLASYDGRKNLFALVSAFDQVAKDYPQARLLCAGNVADARYYKELIEYQTTLASKDKIQFYQFRQDTSLLLSGSDCFVLDSFFEGWSMAATEALLAGLPLIHSECGSARELVGAWGERGRVVPNPAGDPYNLTWDQVGPLIRLTQQPNTQALVEAMKDVIEQREQWLNRREGIRQYALEAYDIAHMIDGYTRILSRISGKKVIKTTLFSKDLVEELAYWDKELSLKGDSLQAVLGGADLKRTLGEFPTDMLLLIEEFTRQNSRIPEVLDVGSGPYSMFTYGVQHGLLKLTAADPLADQYKPLLDRYQYRLDYELVQCFGEQLTRAFLPESFDIAWIHNALDHSQYPEDVLREMSAVLRRGGYLIFQGWSREGTANAWSGLHHHDIYLEPGGRLMCATRDFPQSASLYTRCLVDNLPLDLVEAPDPTTEVKCWIKVIWKKR